MRTGHKVRFAPVDRYLREMALARVHKDFRSFLAPDLLILDDLGLHVHDHQQSIDLYELVIVRHSSVLDQISSSS